ncbi:transmembrane emp24 domain-containing protein 5-like [Anthonomus grandis grandis]|uniref:transmembrane emp24 domain-containing protein 5-like n=1 Tax=Anthonomus grandis grandis TaxID=2921223 RepID=UPI00216635E6|nr:transmembrane emp24 domain-containing protein 5-like [Anthonomus grandis grandis]
MVTAVYFKMNFILLVLFSVLLGAVFTMDTQMTIMVQPNAEDCFFQPVTAKQETKFEIDYQVISGGHGDLDISFYLAEPTGRILVADFKKAEKHHIVQIDKTGEYKFCFDNSFSTFNTKTVYFEISVHEDSSEDTSSEEWQLNYEFSSKNLINEEQIKYFYQSLNHVRSELNKAAELQNLIKVTEAKDRNIAEEAFFKVNLLSIVVLVVMVLSGLMQIILIKSIFEEKSKLHKLLAYLDKYLQMN